MKAKNINVLGKRMFNGQRRSRIKQLQYSLQY